MLVFVTFSMAFCFYNAVRKCLGTATYDDEECDPAKTTVDNEFSTECVEMADKKWNVNESFLVAITEYNEEMETFSNAGRKEEGQVLREDAKSSVDEEREPQNVSFADNMDQFSKETVENGRTLANSDGSMDTQF